MQLYIEDCCDIITLRFCIVLFAVVSAVPSVTTDLNFSLNKKSYMYLTLYLRLPEIYVL